MSEAVCHKRELQYDPCIRFHMQSANGEVDEPLGLAHNVSVHIRDVIIYHQVHIVQSPPCDILFDRPSDDLMRPVAILPMMMEHQWMKLHYQKKVKK